ncbi:MAG: MBL fold metallo-hydrolase [Proteobacteria bacterium]|nr:MBL fold metallo-hydrolase [Pseudomonadota bacterium]MCP4917909.1 MBL fold metallo-hydrolase [Pseudomonadota bacterium]
MHVRFWGVRGSIPVAGRDTLRTGGNTTCLAISSGDHVLLLDGGTGLRAFGESWGYRPLTATVLFTHVHWDHIQGVPFFGPAFHPDSRLTFGGAAEGEIRAALAGQMTTPCFPITLDAFAASVAWRQVRSGRAFQDGPFRITPLRLAHPGGVLAYRVEADGASVVFATDVEHAGQIDPALVELARGADLLVHDAQYTAAEYAGDGGPARIGWGHSTVDEALEVAERAEVGRLALFHHDPARTDDGVAVLEAYARARRPGTFAAREGPALAL